MLAYAGYDVEADTSVADPDTRAAQVVQATTYTRPTQLASRL